MCHMNVLSIVRIIMLVKLIQTVVPYLFWSFQSTSWAWMGFGSSCSFFESRGLLVVICLILEWRMLIVVLMSLWFQRQDSHTVKFANDRLVEAEKFERELISFCFFYLGACRWSSWGWTSCRWGWIIGSSAWSAWSLHGSACSVALFSAFLSFYFAVWFLALGFRRFVLGVRLLAMGF